jgi:uncharacterized protein (TIGR02996 family)
MARNPELEEALCEAPADAIELFLVYGDWLEAQGDPRGELVAVQAKRLGDPNDIALRDAEARILDRHRASLIGDLPVGDGATLLWRLGFIREARIAANDDFSAAELAEAVARSAILPRLQTLSLAMGTMGEEGARAILSNKKAFAHLKQLDLSENFIPDELAGELASVCAEVITDQRDSDGDFRYVVVGE